MGAVMEVGAPAGVTAEEGTVAAGKEGVVRAGAA